MLISNIEHKRWCCCLKLGVGHILQTIVSIFLRSCQLAVVMLWWKRDCVLAVILLVVT